LAVSQDARQLCLPCEALNPVAHLLPDDAGEVRLGCDVEVCIGGPEWEWEHLGLAEVLCGVYTQLIANQWSKCSGIQKLRMRLQLGVYTGDCVPKIWQEIWP
jgi:hypothetical protein